MKFSVFKSCGWRRQLAVLLVFVMVLQLSVAAGAQEKAARSAETITDQANREVSVRFPSEVSSIRLKKVENKFGAHMQLRINLQTRNVENSMTDRQRMDCYGLFTVDLCRPDTVRLIDGLSGIKRGDTISLDMYAKRKANNGKLVFYKNFSLYKADGQGDWHDMINDEIMGPALSRWLDAIGSQQIRNMNAAERENWLRQETEDDLCKIVHKLPAYRAEYSAKKEKSGVMIWIASRFCLLRA